MIMNITQIAGNTTSRAALGGYERNGLVAARGYWQGQIGYFLSTPLVPDRLGLYRFPRFATRLEFILLIFHDFKGAAWDGCCWFGEAGGHARATVLC